MTAKRKRLTAVFQAQAALKGDRSVNGIAERALRETLKGGVP